MSIDWTKPLVVAGTDRVATVVRRDDTPPVSYLVSADWDGDGEEGHAYLWPSTTAVTNAPPTPQLGPEHIEALAEAIESAEEDCQGASWCADFYAKRPEHHDAARLLGAYTTSKLAAEQRAARLAEIRAYLESL